MRPFFIFLITLYQKHLSPYKGFRCAYGCYHQTLSCSGMIKNIIAEHGVIAGWPLIKQQFAACRMAYESLQQQDDRNNRRNRRNNRRNGPQPRRKDNKFDCYETVTDCTCDLIPDVPCDINPCNFYRPLKSIQENSSQELK